mmetsp:Transcript_37896/g.55849  ORF Transcript_37896/g.55849 Transcript_37896/m.55849 type:complete len:128 (+) Transcript_37896:143-526(+)|eukprot:CAMPEP_0195524774 /NCGR_PEP_ID=MMETSP0794_2-20130614/24804_1 /TAXON_ID=515487 /ORGANISM="Stephanopyxis turris, Strain CCMP 815" /LENGTH=127 /DNA_ID=CAMNT_0040655065 /DNA_START=143 /DNA_END=526 /DNA_ORIENTATION=+
MGASHSIARAEPLTSEDDKSMIKPMSDESLNSALADMPMYRQETFEEKLYRKVTKEPLVPAGCLITAYFLTSGIRSFMNRDSGRSQLMMRCRVGAQFLTIAAFCAYAGYENVELLRFDQPDDAKDEK